MEFNTIAISDGITMGTRGMKTSLVSREVIADSIELTTRGYQFDAIVGLSACDKTIPGLRDGDGAPRHPVADALRGLDRARPLARQGRDDPRCLRGDRRPRRRRDVRRGPARARGRGEPRPRGVRRPVHRQHDGVRVRGARGLAGGVGDGARRGRRQAQRRRAHRRDGDAGAGGGPAPEPHHHAQLARERDRDDLRVGRFDQRRAAHARGRARDGDRARDRRLRAHLAQHPAARRPQARRPLRRHRPLPGRRRAADPQAPARRGHPAPRRDDGHRPHDRRGGRGRHRGRGPGGRAPARRPAQEPRAGWRSCAATSRRRDPSSSSPAPSARARQGPHGFSSQKRTASAPSRTRRSSPATSS